MDRSSFGLGATEERHTPRNISLKFTANSDRRRTGNPKGGETDGGGEMATQVEPLLPGNPLAKAEEHGKVIRGEPEEEEGGRVDGAERQTGVADKGSSSSGSDGGCSPGQGGTPDVEEQTSKPATEESQMGCDSEDKQSEEGGKSSSSRKEFTDAPPPKVNPWTRKMNAVTVVSVNGQAHHGLYPASVLLISLFVAVPAVCVRPGVVTLWGGGGWGGGRLSQGSGSIY